jgi:hypothetical protein
MDFYRIRVFNGLARRAVLASSALVLFCAAPSRADDWQFNITPYVWAANLGAKVSTSDRPAIDRDVSFGDLFKNLDMTAQIHFEAQHGRNGLMLDVFSNQFSKDSQIALPQLGGAPANLSSRMTTTVLDAGGVFNPTGNQQRLTVTYGSRMLIQRATIDAQISAAPSIVVTEHQDLNGTKVDALVGARYAQPLVGGLSALAHADVSAGGTRYTWSGSAGLSYALGGSGRYVLTAGYRRMEIKLNGDNSLDSKFTLSGFVSGVRVSF